MGRSYDDGMEGGADPCGSPGPGPAFRTGTFDGDGDDDASAPGAGSGPGDADYAGSPGGGSDVQLTADTGTNNEPRPEEWIK